MPNETVRAVASACLVEWLTQPAQPFSADAIGALLVKHCPKAFTVQQRMQTFLVLSSIMKYIEATTEEDATVNASSLMVEAASFKAFGIGGLMDVEA